MSNPFKLVVLAREYKQGPHCGITNLDYQYFDQAEKAYRELCENQHLTVLRAYPPAQNSGTGSGGPR